MKRRITILLVTLAVALMCNAALAQNTGGEWETETTPPAQSQGNGGNTGSLRIKCTNGTEGCAKQGDHSCGSGNTGGGTSGGNTEITNTGTTGSGTGSEDPPIDPPAGSTDSGAPTEEQPTQSDPPQQAVEDYERLNERLKQVEGRRAYHETIVRNNVQYRTDPAFKNRVDEDLKKATEEAKTIRERLDALEKQYGELKSKVETLESTSGDHETRISAIENDGAKKTDLEAFAKKEDVKPGSEPWVKILLFVAIALGAISLFKSFNTQTKTTVIGVITLAAVIVGVIWLTTAFLK